jgi:hypothetical protein
MEGEVITLSDLYTFDYGAASTRTAASWAGRARPGSARRFSEHLGELGIELPAEMFGETDLFLARAPVTPMRKATTVLGLLKLLLATAAAVGVLLLAATAAGAQDAGELAITSVDTSSYPNVTAVVTAPPGLGGAGLPASPSR